MTYRHSLLITLFGLSGIALFALLTSNLRMLFPLLEGASVTLGLTLAACALAVIVSVVIGLSRLYGVWLLRVFAIGYIEVFRGTSLLIQLFWIYFVLPQFGVALSPVCAGILSLGLNAAGYGAVIFIGAVRSLPAGQWEACTALNFTHSQSLRRIILPQILVRALPPFGNLSIDLLKNSSVVSLVAISDLAFRAQQLNQATFKTLEVFGMAMVVYLCIASWITASVRRLQSMLSHRTLAEGKEE